METYEGESLIRLLDDPDEEVFEAVSQKITQIGPGLLPELEAAAIRAMNPLLHGRIEEIIRILKYEQLRTELLDWMGSPFPSLLEGTWLMTRFQFPDLTLADFKLKIKPLRDEIWLEISDALTALEKIRIFNTLFYANNRVVLDENHPDSPGHNFINRVLETGHVNEYSVTLLYGLIGQELGMPLFVADMPGYPILAYVDVRLNPEENLHPEFFDVLFYINPTDTGSVHSRNDITNYLIRQSLPLEQDFYLPRSNVEFIRICLKRLAIDYELAGSEKRANLVLGLVNLWK